MNFLSLLSSHSIALSLLSLSFSLFARSHSREYKRALTQGCKNTGFCSPCRCIRQSLWHLVSGLSSLPLLFSLPLSLSLSLSPPLTPVAAASALPPLSFFFGRNGAH